MGSAIGGSSTPAEPRNRRTRSSIVIETDDQQRLLVDTPPDLRLQLTSAGIGRIDAVLYTHAHADHIAGLDEIRILNRIMGGPMPAYATSGDAGRSCGSASTMPSSPSTAAFSPGRCWRPRRSTPARPCRFLGWTCG